MYGGPTRDSFLDISLVIQNIATKSDKICLLLRYEWFILNNTFFDKKNVKLLSFFY